MPTTVKWQCLAGAYHVGIRRVVDRDTVHAAKYDLRLALGPHVQPRECRIVAIARVTRWRPDHLLPLFRNKRLQLQTPHTQFDSQVIRCTGIRQLAQVRQDGHIHG